MTTEKLLELANLLEIDSEQMYSEVACSNVVPMSDDRLEDFGNMNLERQVEELASITCVSTAEAVIRGASKR